ncbi:MAG TPA: DNA-3-methyladenine glycosylase I [Candidatus Limnocylindria bacterium]|nr:DNA-3-methyladenine glycosylase I [Candidatus Limnocylindria bacterium]
MPTRCGWANGGPLEIAYHDTEWDVPSRDDRHLFEMLVLEGAQAGLSWSTILRKRENYRKAFAGFDPAKVARFDARRRAALMRDAGIVRNRQKIEATVGNARRVLAVQEELGSLAEYLWQFVDGRPIQNAWAAGARVPAETAESRAMSKALVQRGFRFVGPTICYAFMQATGMVNDHITTCFRYPRRRSRRA